MDYFSVFDISASGLTVQKLRLDTVALNLANVNTTRGPDGGPFKPMEVIVGQRKTFNTHLDALQTGMHGAEVLEVQPREVEPRLVHDPGHPDADAHGFVRFPGINPVAQMVILMAATHAYLANVRAINVGREMALRALAIGSNQ